MARAICSLLKIESFGYRGMTFSTAKMWLRMFNPQHKESLPWPASFCPLDVP